MSKTVIGIRFNCSDHGGTGDAELYPECSSRTPSCGRLPGILAQLQRHPYPMKLKTKTTGTRRFTQEKLAKTQPGDHFGQVGALAGIVIHNQYSSRHLLCICTSLSAEVRFATFGFGTRSAHRATNVNSRI